MPHVDEGTLHAYLDGELTPVERERVETHLKGCPACQARFEEERAIIERASRLLGIATPPERAMPPLAQLRQRRFSWWRVRGPLAWAATVILAVGLGWYWRGLVQNRAAPVFDAEQDRALATGPGTYASPPPARQAESARAELRPQGHLSMRREEPPADSIGKDRDALQVQRESAEVTTNALGRLDSTTAVAGAVALQPADVTTQLPQAKAPGMRIRGAEAQQAPSVYVDGAPARQRAPAILSTSWPLIARQSARDALGIDPVDIPGFAVRAYRHNPATQEIAVEQVTDAGTTISLIERRVDRLADQERFDSTAANLPRAMAKAVKERLARYVGPLRVEIDGPLTPDSLSRLLELAR